MSAEVEMDQFHNRLVREAFKKALSDRDLMLLFHLLHMYEIEVEVGVLKDVMGCVDSALTQNHASEMIASLYGRKLVRA